MLANKRVLVTGGAGFIFSHLTKRLISMGAEVGVIVKYGSVIDNIRLTNVWDKLHVIEADVRDVDALRKIANFKPDVIYHGAAYNHVGSSFEKWTEVFDVNAKGTANVLEAYDQYERFIYVSTSEVYGAQAKPIFKESMKPNPVSPYSIGKYSGELYSRMKLQENNYPIVVLRPFNAFGPFQSTRAIIPEIIEKCLKGIEIKSTEGVQTREFNYVDNLVDAFVSAGTSNQAVGKIINVGCGKEIAIRDLIKMIHEVTGSSSVLRLGSLENRKTEIWRMSADAQNAAKYLNWTPEIDFTSGLRKTVEWYRNYLEVFADSNSGLAKICK